MKKAEYVSNRKIDTKPNRYKNINPVIDYPFLKWLFVAGGLFLLIFLSKYMFIAITDSVKGFKNMKAAWID